MLNVDRAGLLDAYRQVIASRYSPRALFYRGVHAIADEDVPMAVLCLPMIDARASGVAWSAGSPAGAEPRLLVSGAFGLGTSTVSGTVSPDVWEVRRADGALRIVSRALGAKQAEAHPAPGGGVASSEVAPERRASFCLADNQVVELAGLAAAVEGHFGAPQEIEWAVDGEGRAHVLQARPLRAARLAARRHPPAMLEGHALLLAGEPASAGRGSGPVCLVSEEDDLSTFPAGAVLVARHSSPRLVKAMRRAAAIVTDVGAATGHMASLAREFGVPAVLGVGEATTLLGPGRVVAVDGDAGGVYDGRLDAVTAARGEGGAGDGESFRLLRDLAALIVPLNLTDLASPEFRPRSCRTLHDIARFAHEKAFEAMFHMSDRVADASRGALRIEERLPFELYVIDIGGGLDRAAGRRVRAGDVRSRPMRALLRGLTDPALRWSEPKSISLSGFLSVATESLVSGAQEGQRRLGDRSYAIVAESYCNFSSRIGYHFAAVDAFCSDFQGRNHVSFRFRGGAADDARRARRCELIGEILRRLDFQIERHGDLVNCRLRKYPAETTLDRLDQLGRLIVATRQLDMRMAPGVPIGWFADAFFAGNYTFDPEPREAGAVPLGS